eukprot:TRINITY_DN10121_c1_g1_i4.p1 TRINITY_DN10121_c1_g1~~TRINITY_DN10121_c1_g1_i4.p1  ORF type:complete len:273 (-),score=35.70 TRINITY_DN10121_c1_g1_i4:398-1216(-)
MVCLAQTEYGSQEHAWRFGQGGGLPGSSWPDPLTCSRPERIDVRFLAPPRSSHSMRSSSSSKSGISSLSGEVSRSWQYRERPGTSATSSSHSVLRLQLGKGLGRQRAVSERQRAAGCPSVPVPTIGAWSSRSSCTRPSASAAGCSSWDMGRDVGRQGTCRFHQAAADVSLGRKPIPAYGPSAGGFAASIAGAAGSRTLHLSKAAAWDSACRYHGMAPNADRNPISEDAVLLGGSLRPGSFADDTYFQSSRGALVDVSKAPPRSSLRHLPACS